MYLSTSPGTAEHREYDCVIAGGTVVRHDGRLLADVAVRGGRVVRVGEVNPDLAREVIDATGRMVLPGVIDPHVHLSVHPAAGEDRTQMDLIVRDLSTESRGAAFGGVTTFLPMINLTGSYLPYLPELKDAIERLSYVDAGMTVIVSSDVHIDEIPQMAAFGISGFKHFVTAYRRFAAAGSLIPVDEEKFFASLKAIRDAGPPALAMVHAEDGDLIDAIESEYRGRPDAGSDLRALNEARPPACELSRVEFTAAAARGIGAPVYFCHCTSFEGAETAARLLRQGNQVATEAVTHCLTSNCDEAWARVGGWAKFSPPIRGERDRRKLWEAIRVEAIQHIASDHASWTLEEKMNGVEQFGPMWDVMPGIGGGMEHLLPAMITYGVRANELSWEQLVAATSYNTAARFGYLPRKGDLRPGADADIVIVDPNASEVVGPGFYHGRGGDWSLYWGLPLFGRPQLTMVRGRVIQRDGELVGSPAEAAYVAAG
jgi:dihydropyrimidinase